MKKNLLLIIIMIISFNLVACSSIKLSKDESIDNKSQKILNDEGNTLNIASTNEFEKSKEGQSLIFDTLVKISEEYEPIPSIVTKWEKSDDSMNYTISFNTNMKFHDGSDVDAKDILYSIEKGGKYRYCSYAFLLEKVKLIDDSHLEVHFTKPYIYFVEDLAKLPLVKDGSWSDEGMIINLVGTGPFVFNSTDKGLVSHLTKNKNYWNRDYKTDVYNVKWHTIKDAETRKMALRSGLVDILGLSEHYISIPYSTIDEFKHSGEYKIEKEDDDSYTSVCSLSFNWKGEELSDKNLRAGINHLLDREEIVKNIFFDLPIACGHMYNPKFKDGPRLKPFTLDLDKAKKKFKEANFVLGDEKHPTLNNKKEPLKLELIYGSEEYEKDLAQYLQNYFSKFGIEIELNSLDYTAQGEKFLKGDYDMALKHPWFTPLIDTLGFTGISDENSEYGPGIAVNDEMKKVGEEFLDSKTKEELYEKAEKIWKIQYEESTSAPIFSDLRYLIHNDKFENFHFDPNVFQIDLNGVVRK